MLCLLTTTVVLPVGCFASAGLKGSLGKPHDIFISISVIAGPEFSAHAFTLLCFGPGISIYNPMMIKARGMKPTSKWGRFSMGRSSA
jgi:hypothetical protein